MSHLLHPRHEAFCQAYVRGPFAGNCTASYEIAGFQPDSSNASKLIGRPQIRKRIDELLAENATTERAAAEAHGIEKHKVLSELSKISYANFFDYVTVDDKDNLQVDLTRLEHDQGAAIREFAVEYFEPNAEGVRHVKSTRVRLCDKRLALSDLGKYLGMFARSRLRDEPDTPDDDDDDPLKDLTNPELEDALVGTFANLAASGVDLRDMLDRAVAAGKVIESPNAKPLREHERLKDAIERCRKALMPPKAA